MEKESKGNRTKNKIIDQVNSLLNRKETMLTLDEIASELNLTRSRITNYFPKKEFLMLAIFHRYTLKLNKLIEKYHPDNEKLSLEGLFDYYSKILDVLYEYRFAISYLFTYPPHEMQMDHYIQESYIANKNRLRNRVKILTDRGLIIKEILEEKNFDAFSFQHTNLLTTWIISYRLYDRKKGYKAIKPVYLRGILNCYFPFLTEQGKNEMTKFMNNI